MAHSPVIRLIFIEKEIMQIDLNAYPLPVRIIEGETFLWDVVRKKKLVMRPEERVRQQFISFLIYHAKIPQSLIQVEAPVHIPGRKTPLRTDIIVYESGSMKPAILVEIKRPGLKIDFQTISQLQKYAVIVGADQWIGVTDKEMLSYLRVDGEFKQSGGLKTGKAKKLFTPGYKNSVWKSVINSPLFTKNQELWVRRQYQNGLIGKDDAEISFLGLKLSAFIRDTQKMSDFIDNNFDSALFRGTDFLQFDEGKKISPWSNLYAVIEVEESSLAISVGINNQEKFTIWAIKKGPKRKIKRWENSLEQLFLDYNNSPQEFSPEAVLINFMEKALP